MPDRITELKSALTAKLAANEEIAKSFTMEDGGVKVSIEQRDAYRQNLEDAKDIKSHLDMEIETKGLNDFNGGLDEYLRQPADESVAVKVGAQGVSTPGTTEHKTVAEMFTSSQEWKDFRRAGGLNMREEWRIEGVDLGSMWAGERKDVYTTLVSPTTTLGFGTMQRDPMVPKQNRVNRVRDLFPVTPTTANLIDFFRVTGFTNNASAVPERVAGPAFGPKPQSSLTFAPTTAPVRTIAHWEAAHRNVLDDEPQLQGVINNELLYGLRLHEDFQILNGTGTGEDLLGILNTPGIQLYSQSSGPATDNKADAIRRAMTKIMLAYYAPTGVVMHPNDWEDVELSKDAEQRYLFVMNVAVGQQQTLWRLPVVDTPAIAEGTALVGNFGSGVQLYDRQIANIRVAEQHEDFFVRNAIVILAEERLALAVKRPESLAKVTLS